MAGLGSNVDDLEQCGWGKGNPQSYRHHCGAKVTKRGKLWTSTTVAGVSTSGHRTAPIAATYLQKNDRSFWTYGKLASFGVYDGISLAIGYLDKQEKDQVFACYLVPNKNFPKYLEATFRKSFFGKAVCVKCLRPMDELRTRILREFKFTSGRRNAYIACSCDYPVWRA